MASNFMVWYFFLKFLLSKHLSKFNIETTSKKVWKSRFLTSQNPPQTLPKPIRNRCSRTNLIFYAIVAQTFDIFKRRNLENINFPWGKSIFFRFSRKACFCNFHAFFLPKLIPKPFQNEVRTLQKSMPKTCWFSTSIFWGFGLDLGGSWASKMEPSWPFWPQNVAVSGLLSHLKLKVF